MIKDRFKEPEGFSWGSFVNKDGATIRYGAVTPKGEVRGTMVLMPGFREPAEKYFEVMHDMLERGFAVKIMDWRGQGGSDRYLKDEPMKAHSEGFDAQVRDFKQFMDDIVTPSAKGGVVLNAHSMGAHLALRYLGENQGNTPVTGAVLSAPLLDVITEPFPKAVARNMARFAKMGGQMKKYVPGGGDWAEGKDQFDGNRLTGDPERFAVMPDLLKNNKNLQIGDATYGWVYHAYESIDKMTEGFLKKIQTPVLIGTAGQDKVVDTQASVTACQNLPDCRRVDFPDARHELWMEQDKHRQKWLESIDTFLGGLGLKPAATPKKPNPHKAANGPRL